MLQARESDARLQVIEIGINTHQEPVVYMHKDCHICRSEGYSASTRLAIQSGSDVLIATLNIIDHEIVRPGQIGLSDIALERLAVRAGDRVTVSHAPYVRSLGLVRKKIYGNTLSDGDFLAIMRDVSEHNYRDIEIASFLSVCAGGRLSVDEIIGLTKSMVACGRKLEWPHAERVFDKHCIGGLPGNRTTPLVVAIVSSAGLLIPKTSSRAITSPAGTADTLEVLFDVDFSIDDMQRIVSSTGACLVWGGAVNLSPADDLMIKIERALDLDGEGQLIASVLSKKIAAGSTHVVIDIPVGPSAKIRTKVEADRLAGLFARVGDACGIHVRSLITDGSQPVGRGIGPAQEAADVLAVLQRHADAPEDLRNRALLIAANLIDLAESNGLERAKEKALDILESGAAWEQFQRIATEQGGLKALPEAEFSSIERAEKSGIVKAMDNRRLARLAKLAGAPLEQTAGLRLGVCVGQKIEVEDPLFELFSGTPGELQYALAYYQKNRDLIEIE